MADPVIDRKFKLNSNANVVRSRCIVLLNAFQEFHRALTTAMFQAEDHLDKFSSIVGEDDDGRSFCVSVCNLICYELSAANLASETHEDLTSWVSRAFPNQPIPLERLQRFPVEELPYPEQAGQRNISPECAQAWSMFSAPVSSYISAPKEAASALSAAFTAYLNGSSPDENAMHRGLNNVIKQIGECMDECERRWLQIADTSDAQGGFVAGMAGQALDDGSSLRR